MPFPETVPERHRRVIVLHHIADLSVSEIAAQENVADGTIKSWLHRGRAALAKALTETEETSEATTQPKDSHA